MTNKKKTEKINSVSKRKNVFQTSKKVPKLKDFKNQY